jgi:hypothetical protein
MFGALCLRLEVDKASADLMAAFVLLLNFSVPILALPLAVLMERKVKTVASRKLGQLERRQKDQDGNSGEEKEPGIRDDAVGIEMEMVENPALECAAR